MDHLFIIIISIQHVRVSFKHFLNHVFSKVAHYRTEQTATLHKLHNRTKPILRIVLGKKIINKF